LFGDNLALIIGFNTFLPPGFQIDTDDSGVRVTTPQYSRIHHFASATTSATSASDVRRSATEQREGESGNVPVVAVNNTNNESVDRQVTVQSLPPIRSPDQYDAEPAIANYATSASNIHTSTSNINSNTANYGSSSAINANGSGASTIATATTTPHSNYPGVSSQTGHQHYTKTAGHHAAVAGHAQTSAQTSTASGGPSGPMTSIHQSTHGVSNYPAPSSTNTTASTTAIGGRSSHRNSVSAVPAAAPMPAYGAMPSQSSQPPPPSQTQAQQQPPPQPAEFNHAITFVNKIKVCIFVENIKLIY
jgi:histone deacetylase complex regulatory component SIN3